MKLYGAIEAGGTKFVVGVVAADRAVIDSHRIPTTTPDETLSASIDWLRTARDRHDALAAIGIASFGPLDLDPASAAWGSIIATAKPGWSGTCFAPLFVDAFDVPVGFDTDVNGAALAETRWGAACDAKAAVYVTVGTGIGGGAVIDGRVARGRGHAEMGHFKVPRHPRDRDFAGICPFHGDCLEGLASGPAVMARWGVSLSELDAEHEAHDIIAHYLAEMAMTVQAMLAPDRIVFGGGVMATPGLLARVRGALGRKSGGYFSGRADDVIVAPGLGEMSGLFGGLALAMDAERAG